MATTRHPTTPRVTPGLELGIGSVAVVVLTIMLASAPAMLGLAGMVIATVVVRYSSRTGATASASR